MTVQLSTTPPLERSEPLRLSAAVGIVILYLTCLLADPAPIRAQQTTIPADEAPSPKRSESQKLDPRGEQSPNSMSSGRTIHIQVGPSLPLSPAPFSEHYHPGIGASAVGSLPLYSSLHLEATLEYQRHVPSGPRSLVGTVPSASVDGAEFSSFALGIGARYGVPMPLPVRIYLLAYGGGVRTHIAEAAVQEGKSTRTVDASTEFSPWFQATVGARRKVSSTISVALAPGVSASFTDSKPTYALSVKAGLWLLL